MHVLPAEHHDRDWDAIVVPRQVKERLLRAGAPHAQARPPSSRCSPACARPHRARRPAGTGKTTMARGLAQVAALAPRARRRHDAGRDQSARVSSDMLGESQRNVTRLLTDTIPEIAARRPFTVGADRRVESFAVAPLDGVLRGEPGRRAPRHRRGAPRDRRDREQASLGALRHHHEFHGGRRRGLPVARRPRDALRPARPRTIAKILESALGELAVAVARPASSDKRSKKSHGACAALRRLGRPAHPQADPRGACAASGRWRAIPAS